MRSHDVIAAAGISFRQLDYWVRQGLVRPVEGSGTGSGRSRDFDDDEADVVIKAGGLLTVGLSAAKSIEYARIMVENQCDAVEVNGWVVGRAVGTDEANRVD